jgi:hypothetical protein
LNLPISEWNIEGMMFEDDVIDKAYNLANQYVALVEIASNLDGETLEGFLNVPNIDESYQKESLVTATSIVEDYAAAELKNYDKHVRSALQKLESDRLSDKGMAVLVEHYDEETAQLIVYLMDDIPEVSSIKKFIDNPNSDSLMDVAQSYDKDVKDVACKIYEISHSNGLQYAQHLEDKGTDVIFSIMDLNLLKDVNPIYFRLAQSYARKGYIFQKTGNNDELLDEIQEIAEARGYVKEVSEI